MKNLILTVALGVVALTVAGCHKGEHAMPQMPPPTVSVEKPERRQLNEWDEYTGRLEAKETVELRPRVSGLIKSVEFVEGADVKEGTLLFKIDPRSYHATAEGALAEFERAQNKETQMLNERNRAKGLVGSKAISAEDFDSREKAYIESQAAARSAKATLDLANLNVEYTEIKAPISGRIGRALVTKGNFVSGGNTVLTMIVSTSPVYLYVDVDESAALKYRRIFGKGADNDDAEIHIPCWMQLGDETEWKQEGEIDFMDNRVEPSTGTMRVRAVFKNVKGPSLAPGLFARLRVPASKKFDALLVPEMVIGSDQSMKYVMVVDDKGMAQPKPVKLGPAIDGKRIVREGLTGDENVIVNGQAKVRPGMPVAVEKPEPKRTAAN